jgi:hypothetical protein
MSRCAGITRQGARCTLPALDGAQFCYLHHPDRGAERSRAASRAGRTGGRGRPGAPELADIRRGLWDVVRDVRSGDLERPAAAVMVQAYGQLVKVCEVQRKIAETDELLERLETLEQAHAAQNGGRAWRA